MHVLNFIQQKKKIDVTHIRFFKLFCKWKSQSVLDFCTESFNIKKNDRKHSKVTTESFRISLQQLKKI